MEGALIEANAELRTIMKRIWKSSASDKVCTVTGTIIYDAIILDYRNIRIMNYVLIKVLDKLVPPPSDPASQDDDIAVGKFYATVLIQVMVFHILLQFSITTRININLSKPHFHKHDIETGLF